MIQIKISFLQVFILCFFHRIKSAEHEINIHSFQIEKGKFDEVPEFAMKLSSDQFHQVNYISNSSGEYRFFDENEQVSELLLLILPNNVAKKIIYPKTSIEPGVKEKFFQILTAWIQSLVGRKVKMFACRNFSSKYSARNPIVLTNVIYDIAYKSSSTKSPNEYIRTFGFDYLDFECEHQARNRSLQTLQNDSTLRNQINIIDGPIIQATITIYHIEHNNCAWECELKITHNHIESYAYRNDEPNTHYRWIILPQSAYLVLKKSAENQHQMMQIIENIKSKVDNRRFNLKFKLLVLKNNCISVNKIRIIENILNDHWPANGRFLYQCCAICGFGGFDVIYEDLSCSKPIPSFDMPGLDDGFKKVVVERSRIPKITVYTFNETDILQHSIEIPLRMDKAGTTVALKANYSFAEANKNLLALMIPSEIVYKILISSQAQISLVSFVRGVKNTAQGIDVKLFSCSAIHQTKELETMIRYFLLSHGQPYGPLSVSMAIFPFGQFVTNEYGYPTYTDDIFFPFVIYDNPFLTAYFQDIDAGNQNFPLNEFMAKPPTFQRMDSIRKIPWNREREHISDMPSVSIYHLNDDIRDKQEGDYIPIYGWAPYRPTDIDVNYTYADTDPKKQYLFIMIPMNVLRSLVSKPKRVGLKPKRRDFHEFVAHIKALSQNLEVKLWAWAQMGRVTMHMTIRLVNAFLIIHAPHGRKNPKSYITIFGFANMDLDYNYCKYDNAELKRFFTKISDEHDHIDISKAKGVTWPGKLVIGDPTSEKAPDTKRRKIESNQMNSSSTNFQQDSSSAGPSKPLDRENQTQ